MPSEELWGEMLGVLKDLAGYLEKADSEQTKANVDEPPNIKEKQDEISGGKDPNGAPGDVDFKKSAEGKIEKATIKAEGKTQLKKAGEEEDEEEEEKDEEEDELKSLLKDIRSALLAKSTDTVDIEKLVEDKISKSAPQTIEKMLRKMGYQVTRPDITRLHVDEKNQFGTEDVAPDVRKSDDGDDPMKVSDNLSKKSWGELARLREEVGDFNVFPNAWKPK